MSAGASEGFRLSPQQRSAWSLGHEGRGLSREWCALLLEGALEPDVLRGAAKKLVATHEILRTTFHRRAGIRVPFQIVAPAGEPAWRTVELSGAAASDPFAAAEELARQESAASFDLERGPLFRLSLASLSKTKHVLLFALPSLCADRRTLHNIARQLASSYAGSETAAAAEPPIQYADFSEWQNELLEAGDEAAQAARAHWRQKRAAAAGGRVPFEGMGDGSSAAFSPEILLDRERLAAIDVFCRQEQVSVADFLLACWQTLLWRTTGDPEVLVGDVQDGRKFDELKDALGAFARALPLAARFDSDPTFDDVVRSNAEARRRNEEWQEYYGRKEDLEGMSTGRTRLPGFEFADRPSLPEAPGVSFSFLREFSRPDAFPVWLACVREGESVQVSCGADPDRLPREIAGRLAAHLEPLIAGAAANPRARAARLPMLAAEERRRLLVDWNRTATGIPFRSIPELFEEQVDRTPDAPALVFGQERLTYAELNARANALAWALCDRGVGPDVRVGLALDRSLEVIVALLAILKAGGAYVPLNPDHPDARLAHQLTESECRLLITDSTWISKFAGFSGEKIVVDGRPEGLAASRDRRNPERRTGPENVVYVLYTSGSTGMPKGVAVRHSSLVNYSLFVVRNLLGIDPVAGGALAFATVSTISADLGNTSIFPSLISGGCLHVIGYETAMEGRLLADYFSRAPVDVLKIVPSHLAALLSSGGGRGVLPRRFLVLGGEALPWELVRGIRSVGGTCEVINHYGPTETTVGSLTFRVASGPATHSSRTVPIGRPISNTEAFVLDRFHEPVPVGVAGELYIGGAGLAQGYVGRPEETAERFVAHPFSPSPGARLYRTGDRVRYLPDASVEFLGRVDDQVKIRGYRIEPGEIHAVLAAHPAVRESAVAAREDSPGERRLVAYVVAAPGSSVSSEELRDWVRKRLPDYMVPAAFVKMKALPLTPNGKVDRNALPPPEEIEADRPYVEPRTPSERVVAGIWTQVLRVARVSAEDNFFDLGGHSLLVTQVVSRMRTAFRRELPIRWMFESPTVAELAARADAAEREDIARILDELESLPEESDRLGDRR